MTSRPAVRVPDHAPLVHVVRGELVEGVHYGSVVVLAPDGSVAYAEGDVNAAFYPRSAIKPVQAVGMVRAGLDLPADLLALAGSSHSGEPIHIDGVRRILNRGGLAETSLVNPVELPYDRVEREVWLRAGRRGNRLAHTCSGKHAAMLLTTTGRGWTSDYAKPDNPLQRVITETVTELSGDTVAAVAVDGCGAPLYSISLAGLARAVARIAMAVPGTAEEAVATAFRRHPEMVAGTRRDTSRLMTAVPGLIAKDGVEGVQVAALPDGWSVGVKVSDGAERALMPLTAAALALCSGVPANLAEFASRPLFGGGSIAGSLKVVGGLARTS